jgi:hypothetical protein
MDRNLALRQHRLKRELAHFRKTARLRERQAFFLEQRQREFPLNLGLAEVSRSEDFI